MQRMLATFERIGDQATAAPRREDEDGERRAKAKIPAGVVFETKPRLAASLIEQSAGLKKAIAQVLGCPWQRCSVHLLREALGHVRKDQQGGRRALAADLQRQHGEQARELVSDPLERLRKPLPKIAAPLEEAEEDLLPACVDRLGRGFQ